MKMRRLPFTVAAVSVIFVSGVAIAFLTLIGLLLGTYAIISLNRGGDYALPADCAIVFGAAVYGQNLPGPAIMRRTNAAAVLWKEGSVNRVILSGGKGNGVRASEAQVMQTFALQAGIPQSAITIEDQSHSTWENLENTRNLTGDCDSVLGISDQYHLARIRLLAWRQGWKDFQTYPVAERPPEISEKRSIYREIFAYIYYAFHLDAIWKDLPTTVQ